jgi:hypothetical protein
VDCAAFSIVSFELHFDNNKRASAIIRMVCMIAKSLSKHVNTSATQLCTRVHNLVTYIAAEPIRILLKYYHDYAYLVL